jgi:murein DD-endopeptidase MepM/ murein hydrolase activator NlpD
LRPDIPHNVTGASPSEPNEDRSPLVDTQDLNPSEVSRQSCQAAMLGVAISVGTCGGLFLPSVPAYAQAATPVVEPTVQSVVVPTAPIASQVAIVAPVANAPATAPTAVTAVPDNAHTVQTGETLWRIANIRGVDVNALASLNQLKPDTVLKAGQVLQLPVVNKEGVTSLQKIAQAVPEVPSANAQQIASNQSATTSNVLSEEEAKARQDRAISILRDKRNQLQQGLAELGDEESKSKSIQSYRVASGDTLASIARQFGVSYRDMLTLNPIDNPDRLQLNQVLQIPTASKTAEVATIPGTERVSATPDGALPVTTLSKTPLPAIGGESPKVVETADVKSPAVPQQVAFNTSNLLSEIKGIRDRYQRQATPYQPATVTQPKDAVVPVVAATAPTRLEAAKTESVNPDFNGRRSDSSLSIELRNFVQPKLKPEEATGKVVASPIQQRQVIARSTLGSEAYAPVAPTVKRMVAPNLPPIGKEDAYLPGGVDASNGYIWPSKGMLSSGYGWRWGRMHRGIDIAAPIGTPIVAVASGTVTYAGWNDGGYGYMVELEHADGTMTRYAHNDRVLVSRGQQVSQGQQISEMGSTGFSTGPHLHFEIHPRGQGAVNPMAFLNSQS